MTHYYYYIKDLNGEVIVYNIKVDEQNQHIKALKRLYEFARKNKHYISIRNSKSTNFIHHVMLNYSVIVRTISIIDMLKLCLPSSVKKSKENNYKPIDFQ